MPRRITKALARGLAKAAAPSAIVRAQNLVDLRRVNFQVSDVLIQGRTVALERVGFADGSRVTLESAIGRLA